MQLENPQTVDDRTSLKVAVDFLKSNRKLLVLWVLSGLLISAAYVLLAPNKYEARWQMQMAQFISINSNGNININSEEPAELVQRLREPTAYPIEVRRSCDVREDGEFADYLDGVLKVATTKNVTSVVGMKVRHSSPDQAKKCAEAIVAMVISQQRGLIEERLAGRQVQLSQYQQALAEEQRQLEKLKKSELGNFGYLAKLDKLSWLNTRIAGLQEETLLSQLHPAKLMAPIFVSSKAASPKAGEALLLGVLFGMMLGVLHALGRREG